MTAVFIATMAFIGFAAGAKRLDVVFAIGGYLFAAILILMAIFFGALWAYTNFVIDLWNSGLS